MPMHGKFARKFLAQTLTDGLQCVLRHDLEREFAHVAKRRGVGHGIVNIEQQQTPDLRRFPLSLYLLHDESLVYSSLTFVFDSLHVIAHSIDKIVGELPVALPGVAQQI